MARHQGKYVVYYRVSTKQQGASGLGLDAQRAAVVGYLNGGSWEVVQELTEIESGKSDKNRPALQQAMDACRRYGAKLLIGKLDRLSRDPVFLLSLRDAGIEFIACDMPQANRLTVGIMAMVAEQEREALSQRTKAALAAKKARGVKLGNPQPKTWGFNNPKVVAKASRMGGQAVADAADRFAILVKPVLDELPGASANAVAKVLNERGVKTARGGQWSARQVIDIRARLN